MTEFATEDGSGTASYDAGVITLSNGARHGVEDVVRLTVRSGIPAQTLPDLLGTLRGALPQSGRLPMPMRLAVSTVRAGLGAIEEGLAPGGGDVVTVEIGLGNGTTIVARMPPGLAATLRRDREVVLAALARTSRALPSPVAAEAPGAEGPVEALTSIFRYEKRNGRLRRVAAPDRKA